MKGKSGEDFKQLMNSSPRLCYYKLKKLNVIQTNPILERLRAFKTFISIDLCHMQNDEWVVFVNNEVSEKFRLKAKDIKDSC